MERIKCKATGITAKGEQTIQRVATFQKMITEVQEECYSKLGICGMARSNPDAIGEVVQVPRHFPNRYIKSNSVSMSWHWCLGIFYISDQTYSMSHM